MAKSINDDDWLWSNIDAADANFLRRFRFTCCPVQGDDDIDDEDDDPPDGPPAPPREKPPAPPGQKRD
jgi:hypothetical protein